MVCEDWILYCDSGSSSCAPLLAWLSYKRVTMYFEHFACKIWAGVQREQRGIWLGVLPLYISLCLSASTSDFSAIACLRSKTVLSVDIVSWIFSSLGPANALQCLFFRKILWGLLTFDIYRYLCWSFKWRRHGRWTWNARLRRCVVEPGVWHCQQVEAQQKPRFIFSVALPLYFREVFGGSILNIFPWLASDIQVLFRHGTVDTTKPGCASTNLIPKIIVWH